MAGAGRGISWMVGSVVLFALANVLVKDLRHLPTLQLVFLRSALSLVVTAGYLVYRRLPVLGTNRRWMLIRGIAGVLSLSAFFHTVRHMPLASATVIQYTSPVFTLLLAGPVLGQTTRPLQWALLAFAFVGVVLIKGFDPMVSWELWDWACSARPSRPFPTSPPRAAATRTTRWAWCSGSISWRCL